MEYKDTPTAELIEEIRKLKAENEWLKNHRDVSGRWQPGGVDHSNEERFQSFFSNAPFGYHSLDAEGHLVEVNQQWLNLLGYDKPEVIGKWFGSFLTPQCQQQFLKRFPVFKKMGVTHGEFEMLREDGRHLCMAIEGSIEYDSTGEFKFTHCILQDITTRKAAHEAIKKSQLLLRSSIESLQDIMMFSVNNQYEYLYFNTAFKTSFFGAYDANIRVGMNLLDCITDTRLGKKIKENLDRALNGESHIVIEEYDGQEITFFETQYNPIVDDNNEIVGVTALSKNITQRKRSEQILLNSEYFLKKAQEIGHLGSWVLDVINNKLIWSDETYRIFGLKEQVFDATYEAFLDAIHPDDRDAVNAAYTDSLRQGQDGYEIEHRIIRKNSGEVRFVHEKCEHVRNASGKIIHSIGMLHDITETRRAQEQLREKEVQYRNLANSGLAIIWTSGTGKLCDYFNDTWLKFTGRTLEQEKGLGWLEGVHPDDREECIRIYNTSFDQHQSFEMEYRLRHASGEYRWILDLGTPNYNAEGSFIGYIGHCFDITDRKNAADALRHSEEKHRSLIENMHEGFLMVDNDDVIQFVNPMLCKMLGFQESELIGTIASRVLLPGTDWKKIIRKSRARQDDNSEQYEMNIIRRTGEHMIFLVNVSPVKDKDAKITGSRATCIDITQRWLTEVELRESEEKYRSIYENSSIAIFLTSCDGITLSANEQACRIFERTEKELCAIGRQGVEDPADNRLARLLEERDLNGRAEGEVSFLKPDGTQFPCYVSSVVFKDNDGKQRTTMVIRDLTAQKKAEVVMREVEVVKASLKFKQNFLANMSHEIRTPLTGVLGMIDILEQTHLKADQAEYVNILKISGENLKEIINQVLDYSKIEAGKIQVKPSVFKFHDVLANTQMLYSNKTRQGVEFISHLDPEIPAIILADKSRLSQILNNLVSNALKFTHKGSVVIDAQNVGISEDRKQHIIKITVSDTGIGIPKELQRKLFKPFSQIDDKDSRHYEGTGLGLTISKELVKLLGGEIGFESHPKRGSNFWFTFPASIPAGSLPSAKTAVKAIHTNINKLCILYAEDKMVNQKVVNLMLNALGHEVIMARDGKQAIELYEPGKFDLILMDIQMPVMDGLTATIKLKEAFTNLPPIVGLSANAFEGDREKYMKLGMDEYLTKPVKKEDFVQLIGTLFSPMAEGAEENEEVVL